MQIPMFSQMPSLRTDRILLKRVSMADENALREMIGSKQVYQYLPTFLFEQQYEDIREMIGHLYTDCLNESLILGVYSEGAFCGLAELYGYKENIHKVSIGYRLLERYWGRGIATETVQVLLDYLYSQTDIEIITASTMIENTASANVLLKNGFVLVVHAAKEDWGYPEPTIADKWIR